MAAISEFPVDPPLELFDHDRPGWHKAITTCGRCLFVATIDFHERHTYHPCARCQFKNALPLRKAWD